MTLRQALRIWVELRCAERTSPLSTEQAIQAARIELHCFSNFEPAVDLLRKASEELADLERGEGMGLVRSRIEAFIIRADTVNTDT